MRRTVTLFDCALCLALAAIAFGCGPMQTRQFQPPLAQSARAVAPMTRGENLFEKGETKYFPVRFINDNVLTIRDTWRPDVTEDEEPDLGYYIGEERFDTVVALISHLDQLDDDAFQHGLVLIQEAAGEGRLTWQQDTTQLCVFAEFKNIDFWLRVPAEAATPETEHAYWLVRHTEPQVSGHSPDTVSAK
jgi:hypothetical protein